MKIIKMFFFITLFATFSCNNLKVDYHSKSINLTSKNSSEKQYVMGAEDIPLFSGLQLVEEDSSSFDTTFGNIVISKYSGDIELKSVKNFYLQTLPQLGWKLIENKSEQISFKREDDKLEIRFHYLSGGVYVKFFIASAI